MRLFREFRDLLKRQMAAGVRSVRQEDDDAVLQPRRLYLGDRRRDCVVGARAVRDRRRVGQGRVDLLLRTRERQHELVRPVEGDDGEALVDVAARRKGARGVERASKWSPPHDKARVDDERGAERATGGAGGNDVRVEHRLPVLEDGEARGEDPLTG